jgi:hypothetical protein
VSRRLAEISYLECNLPLVWFVLYLCFFDKNICS